MAEIKLSENASDLLKSIGIDPPFRNLSGLFSDGVRVAEIIHHKYPRIVQVHNYKHTSNTQQKLANWDLLNRKVLVKLRAAIPVDGVAGLVLRRDSKIIVDFLEDLHGRLKAYGPTYAVDSKQQQRQQASRDSERSQINKSRSNPADEEEDAESNRKKDPLTKRKPKPKKRAPTMPISTLGERLPWKRSVPQFLQESNQHPPEGVTEEYLEQTFTQLVSFFRAEREAADRQAGELEEKLRLQAETVGKIRYENQRDLAETEKRLELLRSGTFSCPGSPVSSCPSNLSQIMQQESFYGFREFEPQEQIYEDDEDDDTSSEEDGAPPPPPPPLPPPHGQAESILGLSPGYTVQVHESGVSSAESDDDAPLPPPPPPMPHPQRPDSASPCNNKSPGANRHPSPSASPIQQGQDEAVDHESVNALGKDFLMLDLANNIGPSNHMEDPEPLLDWIQGFDPKHELFYYINVHTRESTWDTPAQGLIECKDEQDRIYYVDAATKQSSWGLPFK